MLIRFRNYCVIGIGDMTGFIDEITSIAANEPNILYPDNGGLLIASFSSVNDPSEIKDFFKSCNRTHFVFDLDEKYSGVHVMNKEIQDGLFGFLNKYNQTELDKMSSSLTEEIYSSSGDSVTTISDFGTSVSTPQLTDVEIAKMTVNEKNELINILVGKDGKNISEADKKLLEKLLK